MSAHSLKRRLFRLPFSSNTDRGVARSAARVVPRVEFLEDRAVPAYTATLSGSTATFTGNSSGGTGDIVVFSQSGGFLVHNRGLLDAGFDNSGGMGAFDFDSTVAGVQMLPASAASAVLLTTGGGPDLIQVGGNFSSFAAAASTLLASFSITNSASNSQELAVDDSGSSTDTTYTETSVAITAPGINVTRGGAGFSGGILLSTGSGNDTVNLRSVAGLGVGLEPVSFFTNGGNDTVNIGSLGNSVDGFVQAISVNTGAGTTDAINVNDQGSIASDSYTIKAGTIQRTADSVLINYNNTVESVTLNAGDTGNDALTLDFSGGALTAAVTYNGGTGGLDTLTLANGTAAAVTHTFTNATDGTVQVTGSALISYTGLDPIDDQIVATDRVFTFAGGGDVVTLSDDAGAVAGKSQISSATSETVVFVNPTGTLTVNLDNGGTGDDRLTVNALDAAFAAPVTVQAGDGNDTLALANGVTLFGGTFDGGNGTDTLDYSAYTTGVAVNLGLSVPSLTATLGGNQVMTPTSSSATGTATVTNYNPATRTFDITVTVAGIAPANVTGFGINRAPVGAGGPQIINLGTGSLTPVAGGFTFTATGVSLPALEEAAFLGGITYLSVQTTAFAGGEIRGQIFSTGNTATATGTATGTAGITGVENATGGSGADSLVGTTGVNILTGGAGNDTIVGAPGPDTLTGGANDDVLVWSNGDGSDLMDGNAGNDLVQVNGSLGATGDQFLVSPNGTRVRLDRTNLGLFNLNIGTVEALNVNGIDGSDTFTVNDLTGVSDLTLVRLGGFAGSDTFNVTPAAAVAVEVVGGDPAPPTTPGDALNLDTTGATNTLLTPAPAPAGQAGTWSFGNRQAVTFRQLETVFPAPPVFTSAATATFAAGSSGAFTITTTGNPVPVLTAGAGLPSGVAFTANANGTATLTGTPTTPGTFTVTITAANTGGVVTQSFTLTVAPLPLAPTGSPPGGGPRVVVRNPDGSVRFDFFAFDPSFRGGVSVAAADLNGDGVDEIIAGAGDGGAPHVKVFDGVTGKEVASFFAYDPSFRGGVRVGGADLDGDGVADIVTGAGVGGSPHVKAFRFNGLAEVASFFAFDPSFRGGVSVASGDLDGDGRPELVLGAGPDGGPVVSVFAGDTGSRVSQFFAGPASDRGGVQVAVKDLDGTGSNELVARAAGATRVFDPLTGADLTTGFTAEQLGGVFVG